MRNDDSLATILLVSRMARDGVAPLNASQFWRLVDQVGDPGGLPGRSEDDLIGSGLGAEVAARVVRLLSRGVAMAFELDRLDQSGMSTLTPFDEGYPERLHARLGSKRPAILHAAGALELLDQPGVGVVGSRNVSREGAEVAKALGRQAASLGLPLISGAARGVDQLAMSAAFQAGGTVVGVPAHSLVRTLRSPDVRRAVHEGRTAMCSPYAPDSPFTVGKAMGRNKLIYALSDVTVAVAADNGSGGTWSGATEAIRGDYCRVAVWRGGGEGPGNEPLERRGALPLTDTSDLDQILSDARSDLEQTSPAKQAALF
ncbi:MAG: DNA-processing protein DprA [bacterium]|nr:DNA-processing protein DprA [bacterium]MDE0353984.1 DNA-processing protein DprA [bacterium]